MRKKVIIIKIDRYTFQRCIKSTITTTYYNLQLNTPLGTGNVETFKKGQPNLEPNRAHEILSLFNQNYVSVKLDHHWLCQVVDKTTQNKNFAHHHPKSTTRTQNCAQKRRERTGLCQECTEAPQAHRTAK